ncbi:MAG: glycosyltransferase [Candidatus Promineifilaceae bacterium]
MQIGHLTACYRPVLNGVTRMVALYRRELERLGHQVTIFTLANRKDVGAQKGVVRSAGLPLGSSGYHVAARLPAAVQAQIAQMDILHCHHPLMALEFGRRYGRAPIIFTNHTRYDHYLAHYLGLPAGLAARIMRAIWPRLLTKADVVIAPSQSLAELLIGLGVRPPAVIENGINLRLFHEQIVPASRARLGLEPADVLAVYVGRLSGEKGIAPLVSEIARARRQEPRLALLLVGGGPQAGRVQALAGRLGLRGRVHLAGPVAPAAVPAYLAAADLFVTASTSETHPLSVIEALAAGLPVVGYRAAGLADLVDSGRTGLLCPTERGALAASLLALVGSPALRRELGVAAREAGRRFDIRRTVARTLEAYEAAREVAVAVVPGGAGPAAPPVPAGR